MTQPSLLMLMPLDAALMEPIAALFDPVIASTEADRRAAVSRHGARIDAVLTTGAAGLTAAEMDAMPRLRLVCAFGAGYEAVDVEHAASRGIACCNGPGVNDDSVADHAVAMLLSSVRGLVLLDRACRDGLWRDALPQPEQLAGHRVGLLGLGRIGRKIARRLTGFDVAIGYCTRTPVVDQPYRHFATVEALATWADHLVVAAPGGPETRHLVGESVLEALGPRGLLVNVGRGSIVDTRALVGALQRGTIGGAALDVYEGEPAPPTALFGFPNVLVTPHVAGSSPQAMQAAVDLFVTNAGLHFAGRPLATPIGPPPAVRRPVPCDA